MAGYRSTDDRPRQGHRSLVRRLDVFNERLDGIDTPVLRISTASDTLRSVLKHTDHHVAQRVADEVVSLVRRVITSLVPEDDAA